MTERPILFSAPMVRALLAGTKTQTRRVVKPQPDTRPGMNCTRLIFKDRKGAPLLDEALEAPEPRIYVSLCPYGQPGDRLYVREAFSGPHCMGSAPPSKWGRSSGIWYWADGNPTAGDWTKPKPGIHMPRWASRITLEVTAVRVERLQDISEADAMSEGSLDWAAEQDTPVRDLQEARLVYRQLWEDINGPGSWDANPWVWVVEVRAAAAISTGEPK